MKIKDYEKFLESFVETRKSGLDIGKPQIGDYVIAKNKYWTEDQNRFFSEQIGEIIYINYISGKPMYRVGYKKYFSKYPNRSNWENNTMGFWRNEIVHWSKNKSDLEPFTEFSEDIYKYNL